MTIREPAGRLLNVSGGDNLQGIVTPGNDRAMLINSAGNRELQSKAARRHNDHGSAPSFPEFMS